MIITHMPLSMEARLPVYAQLHGLPPRITSPLETVAKLIAEDKIDDDLFEDAHECRFTDANNCVTCYSSPDFYWIEEMKQFVHQPGILLPEPPLTLLLGIYTGHSDPATFPVYTVPDKDGNAGCIIRRTLTFDLILDGDNMKENKGKMYCAFILIHVFRSTLLDIIHEGNCDVVAERILLKSNPAHHMQSFMRYTTVSGNSPYCNQSEPLNLEPSWNLYPCIDREHTVIEDYFAQKTEYLKNNPAIKESDEFNTLQDHTAKSLLEMIDAVCELRVP